MSTQIVTSRPEERSGASQRVGIRAKALAGDRELPAAKMQFISEDHVYVAFGQRGTPERPADRTGEYPYYAIFVGFVVFGDRDAKSRTR